MNTVQLNLDDRCCRIHIGPALLDRTGKLVSENAPGTRFAIVTNPKVNRLYGKTVARSLDRNGLRSVIFEVPDNEKSKSLEQAKKLYSGLSANGFDITSCVIGLGGGVVGDLAGFVAATYLRGIPLILLPTTLLSQVDAAIGGKTALNLPGGKNLIGTFHQPVRVISDIDTLVTLPGKDFISGLAEVVKYGMISDNSLFSLMGKRCTGILRRDPKILAQIVRACSSIKARIVELDERDRGKRLSLNYGHTLGHALEAAGGYSNSRHGEAVSVGMLFAARLSVKLGFLAEGQLHRLSSVLVSYGLPGHIDKRQKTETILKFMRADKKSIGGKLRFVLPVRIGEVIVSDAASPKLVVSTLEEMRR